MILTKLNFSILVSFLFMILQFNAQESIIISKPIPKDVKVIKDIVYVNYDERELLLDIYRPAKMRKEELPTILVLRGGGWRKGDKDGYRLLAANIALKGFATVCIEYRSSEEAVFPAALLDLKSAIKWIHENSIKYNFDTTSIGAIGGSSGAHIAMMAGVTNANDTISTINKLDNYKLNAIVALATPTDLTNAYNNQFVVKLFGKPYVSNKELWKSASPFFYIDKNSPPMLFIHSENDKVIPSEQSRKAVEKLKEAGVYSELILIQEAPHAFYNYEEWFGFTIEKSAAFLNTILKN